MLWMRPATETTSSLREPASLSDEPYLSMKVGIETVTWNLCGYGFGVERVRWSLGMARSFWMARERIS